MYEQFLEQYPHVKRHRNFTSDNLELIRDALVSTLANSPHKDKVTIVATGSYGRGEASESSDLDVFILFDSDRPAEEVLQTELELIKIALEKVVPNPAGDTGTFGPDVTIRFDEMLKNLGGDGDTNQSLTRRMLLLLEGTWLYGADRFARYRCDLLEKYIKEGDPDRQISRFLLNDIIRYYRTITTDFEYKVSEGKKPWGLRNVKLRFSRKLLYFGGVLVVAEIATADQEGKLARLPGLLDLPVLERIHSIGQKNKHTTDIFEAYEAFLIVVTDVDKRKQLEYLTRQNRSESELFSEIRVKSKAFSNTLAAWLREQYDAEHPIHNALMF
ncbi:nucleotidyltransferase domain-containing protein [Halopseudomonas sp.]|uniref:nucleotidyltransferase domain-containing protein n=1 Tax=Halopseudomonas sp. TaxID=2901191 RepID=UPI00300189F6